MRAERDRSDTMKQPTKRKKPQPKRHVLDIGKWAAMEMLSIQYGFPLREQPEPERKPAKKGR